MLEEVSFEKITVENGKLRRYSRHNENSQFAITKKSIIIISSLHLKIMSTNNDNNAFITRVSESFQASASLKVENQDLKERLKKLGIMVDGLSNELEQYKDMLYHVLERPFAVKDPKIKRSNKNKGNSVGEDR